MSNYAGNETLRAEVAVLEDAIYMIRKQLSSMERRLDKADTLTERLARQSVCRTNALLLEAYREALALDACFKD
ncbi:hypothetical protein [Erwinia mallotivora]|uniref:hypothetical protein n=1 Tax=Erwinia mallotivora TaxID=69222 RepID=UPI0021C1086C|nr:hypothetical protein [Erwinia mallotivora]